MLSSLMATMILATSASAFRPALRRGTLAATSGLRPRPAMAARSLTMSAADKKTVLVPIATGSEEIETTCIVDTLVRAGAEVTVASVEDELVCVMSRGVKIMVGSGAALQG